MLCAAMVYIAMDFRLVPLTTGVAIPWTTPIFISGIRVTNSIAAGILQLEQAVVIEVIWLPFLKAMDKQYLKNDTEEDMTYRFFKNVLIMIRLKLMQRN
ncbi:hypothetical protein ACN077_16975 [Clostridium chromiireducens]|uniref:hypothetical protein n=1 Tax=Clostridium chromiireducens TaxID=225345 RepID=UPI003AF76A46